MKATLYVYQTGGRLDGFDFAIGCIAADGGSACDVALFRSKVDAHLYVHGTAERLYAEALILPSAELGVSRFGWPLSVVRAAHGPYRRGDLTPMCPECSSYDSCTVIKPGGCGTGPGGRWRLGDPGRTAFIRCNACQHEDEYQP